MPTRINPEYVLKITRAMKAIGPTYPCDAEALEEISSQLLRICRTEEEADYAKAVCLGEDRWPGVAFIEREVQRRFRPYGDEVAYKLLGPGERTCPKCGGLGTEEDRATGVHHWCDCPAGLDRAVAMAWYLDFANSFQNKSARLRKIRAIPTPGTREYTALIDSKAAESEIARIKEEQNRNRKESTGPDEVTH
ncbi:MAG: hypothetical protein NVSMB64_26390 [Candidatus Velthaea sp.]